MKITVKKLIENSGINAKLIRGVIAGIHGIGNIDTLNDVARHGASGGYGSFVYYADTIAFTKKFRKEIIAYALEQSRDFGQNLIEFFTSFNTFNFSKCTTTEKREIQRSIENFIVGKRFNDENDIQLYNVLAWYALESVAYDYVRLTEEEYFIKAGK